MLSQIPILPRSAHKGRGEALDHLFGSENWRYVQSTIPNALLYNVLDRLLIYLDDVVNLLISGDAPYEESSMLAHEMIIQNIKVSQT